MALANNALVSTVREKSFGAPEAEISPLTTQIQTSAQMIFLYKPQKNQIELKYLRINLMN